MTYEDILPVIVTLDDAIKHKSYLDAPIIGHTVGEVEKSIKEDEHLGPVVEKEFAKHARSCVAFRLFVSELHGSA